MSEQDSIRLMKIDMMLEQERADPPRWRAELGGHYMYVNESGEVYREIDIRNPLDIKRHDTGNYFKDKESADVYAKMWRDLFAGKGENHEKIT